MGRRKTMVYAGSDKSGKDYIEIGNRFTFGAAIFELLRSYFSYIFLLLVISLLSKTNYFNLWLSFENKVVSISITLVGLVYAFMSTPMSMKNAKLGYVKIDEDYIYANKLNGMNSNLKGDSEYRRTTFDEYKKYMTMFLNALTFKYDQNEIRRSRDIAKVSVELYDRDRNIVEESDNPKVDMIGVRIGLIQGKKSKNKIKIKEEVWFYRNRGFIKRKDLLAIGSLYNEQ